jgi:hypothetical protein
VIPTFVVRLCEHATANADGTYTIFRGGITFWRASLPVAIGLVAFVELPSGSVEAGEYQLSITTSDGTDVRGLTVGKVVITQPEKTTYLAMPVEAKVERYSTVVISIRIVSSGTTVAEGTAPLHILPLEAQASGAAAPTISADAKSA